MKKYKIKKWILKQGKDGKSAWATINLRYMIRTYWDNDYGYAYHYPLSCHDIIIYKGG